MEFLRDTPAAAKTMGLGLALTKRPFVGGDMYLGGDALNGYIRGVSVMNDRRASTSSWLTVRPATEGDLPEVADMVQGFVHGHPAEHHPRPLARLKEAYFGSEPVAHLLVASTRGRLVGMGQWTRIYDMLWAMFGGEVGLTCRLSADH